MVRSNGHSRFISIFNFQLTRNGSLPAGPLVLAPRRDIFVYNFVIFFVLRSNLFVVDQIRDKFVVSRYY